MIFKLYLEETNLLVLLKGSFMTQVYQPVSIQNMAQLLFSNPPKEACTYRLVLLNPQNVPEKVHTFHTLMGMMIIGAKLLFGPDITPNTMSEDQFAILKKYIQSVGYYVKHNYQLIDETSAEPKQIINIWFEPIVIGTRDCHGNIKIL